MNVFLGEYVRVMGVILFCCFFSVVEMDLCLEDILCWIKYEIVFGFFIMVELRCGISLLLLIEWYGLFLGVVVLFGFCFGSVYGVELGL